jgi:hypothetical protein
MIAFASGHQHTNLENTLRSEKIAFASGHLTLTTHRLVWVDVASGAAYRMLLADVQRVEAAAYLMGGFLVHTTHTPHTHTHTHTHTHHAHCANSAGGQFEQY